MKVQVRGLGNRQRPRDQTKNKRDGRKREKGDGAHRYLQSWWNVPLGRKQLKCARVRSEGRGKSGKAGRRGIPDRDSTSRPGHPAADCSLGGVYHRYKKSFRGAGKGGDARGKGIKAPRGRVRLEFSLSNLILACRRRCGEDRTGEVSWLVVTRSKKSTVRAKRGREGRAARAGVTYLTDRGAGFGTDLVGE